MHKCSPLLSISAMNEGTCLAAGKHVHEGGLAGPRHAHEAGQAPGLEGPADVVQQRQLRPGRALHPLARLRMPLRQSSSGLMQLTQHSALH